MQIEEINNKIALSFEIVASQFDARASILTLPHGKCRTPMFMPVGTQAAIKGITSAQMEELDVDLMLSNTYFMNLRPGPDVVAQLGGLHGLMCWNRCILTDSGGFQMVSLLDLSEITEEGVLFKSPIDGKMTLLTPEESIRIQNKLGSDIIMALDDVVPSTLTGPRVSEAQERTVRWLDRCYAAHSNPATQNLFAIVQGGLDMDLRKKCVEEFLKRDDHIPGYAIGGLSGGEEKDQFWRVVHACAKMLPKNKPRYCMGVGYSVDIVVCSCLGIDMFDCVYPCRTARFGTALADVPGGVVQLRMDAFAHDSSPIDAYCDCFVCKSYTRARLHEIAGRDGGGGSELITYHNIAYMMNLTRRFRMSLIASPPYSSSSSSSSSFSSLSSSSSSSSPSSPPSSSSSPLTPSTPFLSFIIFFLRTIFPRRIDMPAWVTNALTAALSLDLLAAYPEHEPVLLKDLPLLNMDRTTGISTLLNHGDDVVFLGMVNKTDKDKPLRCPYHVENRNIHGMPKKQGKGGGKTKKAAEGKKGGGGKHVGKRKNTHMSWLKKDENEKEKGKEKDDARKEEGNNDMEIEEGKDKTEDEEG